MNQKQLKEVVMFLSSDEITKDIRQEILELNHIRTTWKDYCLLLLNSTPDPLRSNWRKKLITAVVHSEFFYNSTL